MDEKYERAKKRVEELKGFYGHLITYITVNVILAAVNLIFSPNFLWFPVITFFWGIGLVSHAASIFLKRGIFSKEWEEKKIKKYMEEE